MSLEEGKVELDHLITRGRAMLASRPISEANFDVWRNSASETIVAIFTSHSAHLGSFDHAGPGMSVTYGDPGEEYYEERRFNDLGAKVAVLEALSAEIQGKLELMNRRSAPPTTPAAPLRAASREIFVVHGHDEAAKVRVARFLERLKFTPVILHERPDLGQTIMEKLEKNAAGAAFAVVLLTPDDVGNAKKAGAGGPQSRARQNVILEMGLFIGRLGRSHVCALYAHGVELPSDLAGLGYTPLDEHGAWETKLAKELRAAGLDVDMNLL
jgi:predicted nucleotide-binding protein